MYLLLVNAHKFITSASVQWKKSIMHHLHMVCAATISDSKINMQRMQSFKKRDKSSVNVSKILIYDFHLDLT